MCLAALALDTDRRFPLVVAANRDEFFARPASRLAWWSPGVGLPEILSGRDLQAGGTWLGLTAEGRFGLVTNVRRPVESDPQAPSRGEILTRWLRGDMPGHRFWPHVALAGHQPFNLIAADFRQGDCFWATSELASPQRIERGVVGISNGMLDAPWPKVTRLKDRVEDALHIAQSSDALASLLFAALADKHLAPADQLPSTGVSRELEMLLSAAFIRSPDQLYGTRCSTVIVTERVQKNLVTHVFERTFSAGPGLALLRRSTLKDWPPKYLTEDSTEAHQLAEVGPVSDSELAEAAAAEPVKKRRVRSLLRPSTKL
jgi:uncharacterized protein with NRDE domain